MSAENDEPARSATTDWVFTALAVTAFFAYVLVIGFAPELFARPVTAGGAMSIGLASGIALTIYLVALCGVYTYLRNKWTRE